MPPARLLLARALARSRALLAALLALTVTACAEQAPRPAAVAPAPTVSTATRPEPLNSERIAARFGSYGVEVLESDARVRVSDLYSGTGDERTCRTFAVVLLPQTVDPRLADEHRRIVAGGSLGAVLKEAGWQVDKLHLLLAELPVPAPGDRIAQLMRLAPAEAARAASLPRLAIDVYELDARRGDVTIPYVTIAEVHHPDYLRLADLRALHGDDIPAAPTADGAVTDLLTLVAEAGRAPLPLGK